MLVIEVDYLSGVTRAARDDGETPDWPPQPDRLFSALVASWAARGEDPAEADALRWLEALEPPPVLLCSSAGERSVVPVFVPPNDDVATRLAILPTRRRRQPRAFPAVAPDSPVVRFVWAAEPDSPVLTALDALARDTSYLGHSASVVRCRAFCDTPDLSQGRPVNRRLYPGRLAELVALHQRGERPRPGAAVFPPKAATAVAPASVFGAAWMVFAHTGEKRPDTVAAAVACKTLLRTVLSGYGTRPIPAWVSGHAPDGTPLTTPHLAAVPLLDAGWEHSRGRLMGLALVLPRFVTEAVERARDPLATTVDRADVAALDDMNGLELALSVVSRGRRLQLRLPGGLEWQLSTEPDTTRQSLRPDIHTGPSTTWATVTPLALDRHPKRPGDIEDAIARACERIDLPTPKTVMIAETSALRGVPPLRSGPEWTRWRLPDVLARRRLVHAVINFATPVAGPVILGAGRFVGLGLCRPLDSRGDSDA